MTVYRWLAALLLVCLVSSPGIAAPERFVLDESHVSVGFLAGHARFARVLGQFTEVSGDFVYDAQTRTLASAEVTIAADSVFTAHEGRDEHLRDDDFLAAGAHPTIRFVATDYQADDDRSGTVTGDLTLRGVTRPITLDVTLNRRGPHPIGGADTLGGSLRGSLRRSEFGMTYALEDELVSDRIDLIIEFEATRDDG
jgi:polyisoprenoid-binding protein YceI